MTHTIRKLMKSALQGRYFMKIDNPSTYKDKIEDIYQVLDVEACGRSPNCGAHLKVRYLVSDEVGYRNGCTVNDDREATTEEIERVLRLKDSPFGREIKR